MRANNGDAEKVHPPLGTYSHSITVGAGRRLVFLSGQVGVRPDGSIADDLSGQAETVFANIAALLEAESLGVTDLVKLTIYLVKGGSLAELREVRSRFLGEHRPAATAIFIEALAGPEMLVEIEAIAEGPAQ